MDILYIKPGIGRIIDDYKLNDGRMESVWQNLLNDANQNNLKNRYEGKFTIPQVDTIPDRSRFYYAWIIGLLFLPFLILTTSFRRLKFALSPQGDQPRFSKKTYT
jgi:hypothetical protein